MRKIKTGINLLAILLVIIGLSINVIGSVFEDDAATSVVEARRLAQFQKPEMETLLSGEWFTNFETYCTDQFWKRDEYIIAYYSMLDALQVKERNGFVLGDEMYVMPVNTRVLNAERATASYGNEHVDKLKEIQGAVDDIGGDIVYINIPNKHPLYWDMYPKYYDNRCEYNKLQRESIKKKVADAGITVIDAFEILEEKKEEYIYYITDHHYNAKGAYYVYVQLLEKLNEMDESVELTFPEWEELRITSNSERMAGSYLKKWGDSQYIDVDTMEYAIPYDMPSYDRYDNGEISDTQLTNENICAYASFMGGDIGNTIIDTHREELPSILYIGDSFTNLLEVYSVYNFNRMESIDFRYWDGDICEYIKEHKPDYVVIIRENNLLLMGEE